MHAAISYSHGDMDVVRHDAICVQPIPSGVSKCPQPAASDRGEQGIGEALRSIPDAKGDQIGSVGSIVDVLKPRRRAILLHASNFTTTQRRVKGRRRQKRQCSSIVFTEMAGSPHADSAGASRWPVTTTMSRLGNRATSSADDTSAILPPHGSPGRVENIT